MARPDLFRPLATGAQCDRENGDEIMGRTQLTITLPDGGEIELDLIDDDVVTLTLDGRELIGVIGDSGAGWWPTGDGGERNGDWTPLRPAGE